MWLFRWLRGRRAQSPPEAETEKIVRELTALKRKLEERCSEIERGELPPKRLRERLYGVFFRKGDASGREPAAGALALATPATPTFCDDVLLAIFSKLEVPDLISVSEVSRAWRRAAARPELWRLVDVRRSSPYTDVMNEACTYSLRFQVSPIHPSLAV